MGLEHSLCYQEAYSQVAEIRPNPKKHEFLLFCLPVKFYGSWKNISELLISL